MFDQEEEDDIEGGSSTSVHFSRKFSSTKNSRLEDLYYFCNCNRISSSSSSFGWLSPRPGGRRQPIEMKTLQRWVLFLFVMTSLVIVMFLWASSPSGSSKSKFSGSLRLTLDLDELTERHKCPACFGVTLCPQMLSDKIKLSDWTKYSITKLMNQKNVYYAEWNDSGVVRNLLLKKLAHDNELSELDKAICSGQSGNNGSPDSSCVVSDAVRSLIGEYSEPSSFRPGEPTLGGHQIFSQHHHTSDVLLCPSHRKMDYLVAEAAKFNRGVHKSTILANVLTSLLLNSEPLMLQAFPKANGFPFPEYFGSCGRLVAEEYVGPTLTFYYSADFKVRAAIAKQLLEMANTFYENESEMILYFTDPSADNFAIRELESPQNFQSTAIEVVLVDLEGLIVVDKQELFSSMGSVKDSDKRLVSQSLSCEPNSEAKCFTFVTEDLCHRPLTDHNYYAICAGLLAPKALELKFPGGLLHSIPEEDETNLPNLRELLLTCQDPTDPHALKLDRFEAAQKLIKVLGEYLEPRKN